MQRAILKQTLLIINFLHLSLLGSSQLEVFFDYKIFFQESKPYLETHLKISAGSLKYLANENGIPQAKINSSIIIEQNGNVVDFTKKIINGPELLDSIAVDVFALERFSLDSGSYSLNLILDDANDSTDKEIKANIDITIPENNGQFLFSDIILIDQFSKTTNTNQLSRSGYDILPLVNNFLDPEIKKLAYYVETYNSTDSSEKIIIKQRLMKAFPIKTELQDYTRYVRKEISSTLPFLQYFDISNLASGKYYLSLQVINRENLVVAEKEIYFERFNHEIQQQDTIIVDNKDIPLFAQNYSEKELDNFIASLSPIAGDFEQKSIQAHLGHKDYNLKRKFFNNFWVERNASNPEDEWMNYYVQLKDVNHKYGTRLKQGFETDRGRVFLKYGPPNSVQKKPSTGNTYPYEIWHYYRIDKYNNKRFIFYLPSGMSNDYLILHSDVPGELNNPYWESQLNKGISNDENVNQYYQLGE